jgi:hypothetical protein
MTHVVISSTTKDLEKHRQLAISTVNSCGMKPLVMEHLGATSKDPLTDSMELVDQAHVYILIIGKCYGSIPESAADNPDQVSITELEYRRAMERPIPKYIFVMDDEHIMTPDLLEAQLNELKTMPVKQQKLTKFKSTVYDVPRKLDSKIAQISVDGKRYEKHIQPGIQSKSGA